MPVSTSTLLKLSGVALALGASTALAGCANSEPTPQAPALEELSPQQVKDSIQRALDQDWSAVAEEFPDTVRPTVELVRLVTPAEQPEAVASCLRDAGYADAESRDDGALMPGTVPAGQESAHALTKFTCYAKYPIDPKYDQPPNEAQLRYLYAYWQNELVPCLEGESVSVADAPSWAVFQETYGTPEMWDPYKELASVSDQDTLQSIMDKCVRYPSAYLGY
jgi:hypothetical protein